MDILGRDKKTGFHFISTIFHEIAHLYDEIEITQVNNCHPELACLPEALAACLSGRQEGMVSGSTPPLCHPELVSGSTWPLCHPELVSGSSKT